jgi:probable rRNA maturation factor
VNIVIANRQRTKKINKRLLRQITGEVLAELKISHAKLGINLVAAPEMTLVNEAFLKHTGSTDVITFDYAVPEKRKCLHGEFFVCVDDAITQAKSFKTSWQSEIVRYIVHGALHLLGHDDHRVAARRRMKQEENRLLRRLSKKFSLAQIAGRSKIST